MTSLPVSEAAWLSSGSGASRPKVSDGSWMAARRGFAVPAVGQATWLVSVAPPQSKYSDASQAVELASLRRNVTPEISDVVELICYSTNIPDPARTRAWTFTLDGHTFYILDLGPEGTWGFDVITKQWCHFYTQGFEGQWNFTNGIMWGDRIIGADILYDYLWELDPNQIFDEEWRPIMHVVTGGLATRSRNSISCSLFHLTGSTGLVESNVPITMNMRFSDDNTANWSPYFSVELDPGDFALDLEWTSLGSFSAPGRIFEVSDSGGMVRIDGADAGLNNFDDDATTPQGA